MVADIDGIGGGARIPVAVRNVKFVGTVRVIVTHLCRGDPGWGAMLLSLPSPPDIGFDVFVAGGEMTRLPWLRAVLARELQKSVAEELQWPRRVVIPADRPGSIGVPLLSQAELDELVVSDPLLRAEQMFEQAPAVTQLGGPLQEAREADASEEPAFDINFSILDSFDLANLTLEIVSEALNLGNLSEFTSEALNIDNFNIENFDIEALRSEALNLGTESVLNLGGNLTEFTSGALTNFTTEITTEALKLANLTELTSEALRFVDSGNLTELVDFGVLVEQLQQRTAEELQQRRRRYEPFFFDGGDSQSADANESVAWWRVDRFFAGGGEADRGTRAEGEARAGGVAWRLEGR